MTSLLARACMILLAAVVVFARPAAAQEAPPAAVAWRLLDYIAVDYSGAVQGGRVVSELEYKEMQDFSAAVRTRLAELPDNPAKAGLVRETEQLAAQIDQKAPPEAVAKHAQQLASRLLAAYPTPVAPRRAPDLQRGARLYGEVCASCHGVTGRADGPGAKGLDPPVIAFTDAERARQRSLFGLYQVITQGLDGTAMGSFAHLSAEDRWALAFYVGAFAFDERAAQAGEGLLKQDPQLRARFSDLSAVTQATPAQLAQELGAARADQLTAFTRRHPEALAAQGAGTLVIARTKLQESLAAYQRGDRAAAESLALSAYLDGFEPVEPTLRARDGPLMARVEATMGELRASISRNAPPSEVAARVETLQQLFDEAEIALSPDRASAISSFLGAFTILLREGLEALLIVVAMVAFLRKAERPEVLPYVHGGWIAALVAGAGTWVAATYLISVSGASRELIEGFGASFSALVLISVGVWMHGKSQAEAWQHYIREKLTSALSKRSAWFLFLLAFVVVYREVFETILFFTALWSQGGRTGLIAGALVAMALLTVIAWILLTYSRKLPISRFFAYSALLIAGLAIVLAGKGVAGLQEAGVLGVRPLPAVPRIEILGVYPTWEGVLAQLAAAAILIVGFWNAGRQARKTA
ncbi:FTR1 family protein [uncultured Phenylobacterium sp.]|uniref:FTR1 family protein n=1 Tax=uncultured Phenylobacterium sp. TaxID=349273 RepID=UPI0025FD2141|nr:FTR1 family protein [uncultured Phenylobacterium sp.]